MAAPGTESTCATIVTVKNTFLEFASPDAACSPALRRSSSSPCLPWFSAAEGLGSPRWANAGGDDDEGGGPTLDLADLLQVQGLPCTNGGKGPGAKPPAAPRRRDGAPGAGCAARPPAGAGSGAGEAAAGWTTWPPAHAFRLPPADEAVLSSARLRASAAARVSAGLEDESLRAVPRVPPSPAPASAVHGWTAHRQASDCEEWPEGTTVMLKNLPTQYTRDMFLELLRSKGFLHHCNFLYLPMNFSRSQNVGYGFLNLTSEEQTSRFFSVFEGFRDWAVDSDHVCSVCWSNTNGLRANIDRYRNSPIMREEVPDAFKPILLSGGRGLPLPGPTKEFLRRLRCRKAHGVRSGAPACAADRPPPATQ